MATTVSRPRFYVNIIEWLIETSYLTDGDFVQGESNIWHHSIQTDFYRTLPVYTKVWMPYAGGTAPGSVGQHSSKYFPIAGGFPNLPAFSDQSFAAILGHNIKSLSIAENTGAYFNISNWTSPVVHVNNHLAEYDGFSLSRFSLDGITNANFTPIPYGVEIGSIVIGTYYEMPKAANLSLSLSFEYGKAKELTSYNGSSYSNTMFTPAKWGNYGAWELVAPQLTYYNKTVQKYYQKLSSKGRRIWDLSFSYIGDSDLWGSNQMLSNRVRLTDAQVADHGDEAIDINRYSYNLLNEDTFFSMWHKTLGGSLPFIFQADMDNDNPDQFAICKFRDNSLKATRSSPNTYDVSVTVEEVF